MKKAFAILLTLIMCLGIVFVPVTAAEYPTFDLVTKDNGDGTVTVTAYAPEGVFSGKLVISNTANLEYVSGSAKYSGSNIFNENYSKNGAVGVCIVFAFSNSLTEKTEVLSVDYKIIGDAAVSASDIFSNEWNLTNGTEFIANQNNGPVDGTYVPKTYTVKFYGFNNELLKEQTVVKGENATAPEAPAVTGYTFTGWDKCFDSVGADITVIANYSINTYTVTFVAAEGGSVTGNTSITVEYGTKLKDSMYPVYNADEGFYFVSWQLPSDYDVEKGVTGNIQVTATFKAIELPQVIKGDVSNDGYVDNIDAALILKYDAGIIDADYYLTNAGDVNGDGYIDNIDAALILKYDAGILDTL